MSESRTFNHPNGYSARLYGETSMTVHYNGKEVLHTGSRNVNTEAEVKEMLEEMPEFLSDILDIKQPNTRT